MDYYEKLYKEALNRAKKIYKTAQDYLCKDSKIGVECLKNTLTTIFPELAESEDEKIRKWIVGVLSTYEHDIDLRNAAIAWLEKQGKPKILGIGVEHASGVLKECLDKVTPKFNVGDTMRTLQEAADNITSGLPVVVSIDEEYYHCNNELIAIKDQDDYEYPPLNRKQKPQRIISAEAKEALYNKPTWSEEDDYNLQCMIAKVTSDIQKGNVGRNNELIDWLKSIKEKMKGE